MDYRGAYLLVTALTFVEVTTIKIKRDIQQILDSKEIDGFRNIHRGKSHFYTEANGQKSRLELQELQRRKRDVDHVGEDLILNIQTEEGVIELDLHTARPLMDESSNIVFRQRDFFRISHSQELGQFFTGTIKSEPNSVAAVTLGDHLEGAFTLGSSTYWFESADQTKTEVMHDVVIGKRDDPIRFGDDLRKINNERQENKDIDNKDKKEERGNHGDDSSRSKRQVTTLTAETVIFVDEAYVNRLKNLGFTTDAEFTDQLLVRLHGMQAEWSRSDVLGVDMKIAIKRIEFWDTDPSWYTVSSTLQNTLASVCAGAQGTGNYSKYDTIHLFTGVASPDVSGKAFTGSVCTDGLKCAVSSYTRATEFTIPAHEFGHVMNMNHDQDVGCPSPNDGIMGSKPTGWSTCSVSSLTTLLSGSSDDCLTTTDVMSPTVVTLESLWPGMIYTDDEICVFKRGPGYRFRYYPAALGECSLYSCIQMDTSASNYGTMVNELWPTDGRYCDPGKVCWTYPDNGQYQCITWAATGLNTSLITSVTGGWSAWGAQTSCSRTCGTGVQYRERFCNNPKPQNSPTCTGDRYELTTCNTDPCPGDSTTESTLIQQRAGETCTSLINNGYISSTNYNTSGNKLNSYSFGQCEVKCDAQSGFSMPTFQRFGLMPDGTPCTPDTQTFVQRYNLPSSTGGSNHCVQGYCIGTGCGGTPGAVRDRCGVCGGTNTTCSVVDGVYTDAISGDTKIYTLPTGSFNIFFYFDASISSMQSYFLEVWEGNNNYIVSYAFNGDTDTTSNPPLHAGTNWYFNIDAQYLWAGTTPTTQDVDIWVTDFGGGSNTGITYGYSYGATNATTVSSGTTTTTTTTTTVTTSTTATTSTSQSSTTALNQTVGSTTTACYFNCSSTVPLKSSIPRLAQLVISTIIILLLN